MIAGLTGCSSFDHTNHEDPVNNTTLWGMSRERKPTWKVHVPVDANEKQHVRNLAWVSRQLRLTHRNQPARPVAESDQTDFGCEVAKQETRGIDSSVTVRRDCGG